MIRAICSGRSITLTSFMPTSLVDNALPALKARCGGSLRLADSEFCREISGRFRCACKKISATAVAARIYARRTHRFGKNSHRPARPQPRLGKRRRLGNNLDTRKPGWKYKTEN